MKEIKFRAKNNNGTYVYGSYVYSSVFSNVNTHFKHCIVTEKGNIYEIEIDTLGLGTGLSDKNNIELFQGDKINFEGYGVFEVQFDGLGFKLYSEELHITNPNKNNYLHNYINQINNFEIIG